MLITLQSNNDSDAASFSNHFKQNVIIPKDSRVALTDISYKFDSGITVASNTTFSLTLGTETLQDITVPAGEYTDTSFVAALNSALDIAIAASSYRTTKAFPLSHQQFTFNSDKVLVLDLAYAPQTWVPALTRPSATVERQKIITSDDATMTAGDGIVIKTTANDSWTSDIWCSGESLLDASSCLWGFAEKEGQFGTGEVNFMAQQQEGQFLVGLAEDELPADLSSGTVSYIFFTAGTFQVFERNTLNSVVPISAAIPYEAGKLFTIQVEEVAPGGDGYILYYYDSSLITINGGVDRWQPRNNSRLVPCGSFFSKKIETELVFEPGTYFKDNVIDEDAVVFTNSGTGYINGEYGEIVSLSTGELTTVEISADVNGAIDSIGFLKRGAIAAAGETLTITGLMSGASDAVITTGAAVKSNDITTPGTGYVLGPATFSNGTVNGSINIIAVNGTGGITDFTWDDRYANTIVVDDYDITQGATTGAVVSVSELSANIPSIGNLNYTVVPKTATPNPLVQHSDITYDPSASFAQLTNTSREQGDENVQVEGTAKIADDRETSMMLVNIDQFEISSICKEGGVQKAIASVPYGLTHPNASDSSESRDGEFYYSPYNLIYQRLGNRDVINHNQIQVRLTDPVGRPIRQLKHPTTLTIDIQ